jgi:hypothetical protein
MSRVIAVRQEAGSTTIVLRPFRLSELAAGALGFMLGLLIVGAYWPPPPERFNQVRTLIGFGVGYACWLVLSLLVGSEEIVTASPQGLVIDRQILRWPRWRKRRTYEARSVKNFHLYLDLDNPAQITRKGNYSTWAVSLAFYCDGSLVRFGAGVMGADADQVKQALAQAMDTPAR